MDTLNRTSPALARVLVFSALTLAASNAVAQNVNSSLLLLIDASGSMGDPVGGGSPQAKMDAAKEAAIAALGRAARGGSVEIAVLAFSGDCANPVPRHQDFTTDVDRLATFIASLQPGGGTPMADALVFANRFMERNGSTGTRDRMVMLLGDGQNDCGNVGQALASLKASGVIFRHETVGFGITPNSQAAQDLREVATQTGGAYHHAADAAQLADVFMEFVNTFSVIDLLGQFGKNAQPPARPDTPNADARPQDRDHGLTGLLGSFTAPSGDAPPSSPAARRAIGDEESFLAVATSPPAGWRIEPGEPGHFGFGWHAGSHHDAGMAAVAECRSQGGGSACAFDAGGTSLRGGCVGLALARWRDRDEDPERAYVVTSSSFPNLIARDLRSGCEREAFGGKRKGTVVEHSCGIVRIMCADDVAPNAAVTPMPLPLAGVNPGGWDPFSARPDELATVQAPRRCDLVRNLDGVAVISNALTLGETEVRTQWFQD